MEWLEAVLHHGESVASRAGALALEQLDHVGVTGHRHRAVTGGTAGPQLESGGGGRDEEFYVLAGGIKFTEYILKIVTVYYDLADYLGVGEVEVETLLRLLSPHLTVSDHPLVFEQQDQRVAVANITDL